MQTSAEHPVIEKFCDKLKKRSERRKRLLNELFHDFARNSTLHGLRYITENGLHIIEKIFWFLTFNASVCISFYFIYDTWCKWNANPVIVSFHQKQITVDEIPFPSVTICPEVKFKQSMFNYTRFSETVTHMIIKENSSKTDFNDDDFISANVLSLVCDTKKSFGDIKYLDHLAMQRLHNLSVNYTDIFKLCSWMGKHGDAKMLFKRVLTKEGVCYNFNGLAAAEILKTETLQRDFNYTFHTVERRNWSLSKGYLNEDKNVYPFRGTEGNDAPTLSMDLKTIEHKRDVSCNLLYSGYKIYLHHPSDLPQALSYHFAVYPDQLASLAVTVSILTTSDNLKSYPVKVRQCYFPEDRPLKYFRIYTYNNCKLECLTDYTFTKCGCVAFYMPFIDSNVICPAGRMEKCILESEETVSDYGGTQRCDCLPACNTIQYDAVIHKSNYHFESLYNLTYKRVLKAYLGSGSGELTERNTVAKVNIYFKEPIFMPIHLSELIGLTDFLGTCGGLLGLFFGFSFLSIVEIVYFLTFRVYHTIQNDLKNEKAGNTRNT